MGLRIEYVAPSNVGDTLPETEGLPTENVFGDKVGFVCIEYRVPYWLAQTIPPLPYILSLPPILGIVADCVTVTGLQAFLSLRCVHMASTHSFISKNEGADK